MAKPVASVEAEALALTKTARLRLAVRLINSLGNRTSNSGEIEESAVAETATGYQHFVAESVASIRHEGMFTQLRDDGRTRSEPMATTRVLKSGNSQSIRLPKQFHFKTAEVEIFQRNDEIVLREKAKGMAAAFHLLAELIDDNQEFKRTDPPPQKRKGL
ncbi:MAG: hypothetical protein V4603_11790 [Pseudomonadota bacterium]